MTPSQTFSDSSSRTSTQTPTNSISSIPSNSKSMPPSPTRTASSTDTPSHTPIETDTPTYTETSSPSYTSNPSQSFGGSLTQTPLAFLQLTTTATAIYNTIPSDKPAETSQANTYGYIGLGVGLGMIATFIVIASYYVNHKKNKKLQRPLSMRNIIYMGGTDSVPSDNPLSLNQVTFRYSKDMLESPKRQTFDPVVVRSENNI